MQLYPILEPYIEMAVGAVFGALAVLAIEGLIFWWWLAQ